MKTNKRGGSKLPIIITAAALIVAAGVFALVYFLNKPKPDETAKDAAVSSDANGSDVSQAQQGAKAYTFTVVGKDGSSKDYAGRTDAAYLKDLMDDMTKNGDFTYVGEEGQYGLFVTTINGVKADFNTDASYWAIYVNGEYGSYGISEQPVNDGDSFKFVYETSEGQ